MLTISLQFDNIPGNAALPDTPIGIYLDLMFNGFSNVMQVNTGVETGVVAQSQPNTGVFSPTDAATILQGTPALTVNYTDSTIAFFDYHNFYFGCTVADQNGVASLPQSCAVTVTGFDTNGFQVAQQVFNFVQNGLQDQMVLATLNSNFKKLERAEFEVEATGGVVTGILPTNATTAVLTDNHSYTVYSFLNQFAS